MSVNLKREWKHKPSLVVFMEGAAPEQQKRIHDELLVRAACV